MILKSITESDLPDLAKVHVQSWQESYADIMDAEFLSSLKVEDRLSRWQKGYDERKNEPDYDVLLARVDGKAVGFIAYGRARDTEILSILEIYAVYLLKEYWGTGIGYKMFSHVRDIFKSRDSHKTYLWVLKDNQNAINAYTRWGGVLTDRIKTIPINGVDMDEIMVTFDLSP